MKTNWQTKKLGEICEIIKDTPLEYIGEKDYFSTGAISNSGFDLPEKVTYKNRPSRANSYPKIGDVGFAKMKFTNKTLLISSDLEGSIFSTGFCFLRPTNLLDSKYLFLFIISDEFQKIKDVYAGDGIMGGIKNSDVRNIEISYPESLSEQKRIVKILDEAFEKIEKAKENAEKNLRNSKELFEYYLRDTFTNTKKDWEVKKLSEIAEYFNGLTYSPKNVSDEGIIVLRSSNVQNDELDFSDIVRVNCRVKEKVMVRDGDILMCSRNGSKRLVGKTATIKNLKEPMTFGTFMMIIRGEYNSYLAWFFKSTEFRKQIAGGENTMINQITRYMLDDVIVSFPPKKELKKVIEKLNELSEQIKKLEEVYKKKMADLEELKKSVLNKAFTGEL